MATPSGQVVSATNTWLDGLLQGSVWFVGATKTITYSIWDTGDYPWSPEGRASVRHVFQTLEQYIDVRFVEVSPSGSVYNNNSDISVALAANAPFAGIGGFPDPAFVDRLLASHGFTRQTYPTADGDAWFNGDDPQTFYLQPGQAGILLGLYEIGHALGLKHPHDDGGAGRPTFQQLGHSGFDNAEWTMMSYQPRPGATLTSGNLATPGIMDVAALQYLYGANPTTGQGDTVYRITAEPNSPLRTIWDVSGSDTIDASAMVLGVEIDLGEGRASQPQLNSAGNAFRIGYWVTIENAAGGAGDDRISGNAINNTLFGGGGSDEIAGLGGDDLLIGGSGDDTFVFGVGGGADTVSDFAAGLSGNDRLDLSALPLSNFDQAMTRASQSGADTVFDFGEGDTLRLQNVGMATLVSEDLGLVNDVASDFNADDRSDILWRHTNGTVVSWLLDGSAIVAGATVGAPGNEWEVEGVGDFNADNRDDVLWRHSNGTVYLWLMNGSSIIGGGVVGAPGNEWQVQGGGRFQWR